MQLEAIHPQTEKKDASSQAKSVPDKWFWGKWMMLVTGVFIIHFSTIAIAPFLHKDEFLIVELGRILLHPYTDWSIAWVAGKDQPAFFLFYLGPVMQNFAYQLIGEYGPRISGSIGALVAATMMVNWLLSRGVQRNVALILGLVFLLDPIFVQSYGLGRVDGWMMAFCIASCWILADVSRKLSEARLVMWQVMLAGALLTVAFFIWPTAVYLTPLIGLELANFINRYRFHYKRWQAAVIPLAYFGGGSMLAGALMLLPVFPLFDMQLFDLNPMQTNVGSGYTKSGAQLASYGSSQFVKVFRFLKFSPVLLLAAAVCLMGRRQGGVILITLAAIAMLIITKVYIHRVIYLVPYFIVAVGGRYQYGSRKMANNRPSAHLLGKILITALLVWAVGISLFIRFGLALNNPMERSRDLVYQAAKTMVGTGPQNVYSTYEFYYAGRSLGWKMYIGYDEVLSAPGLQRLVSHLDYAILPLTGVTSEIDQVLTKAGLKNKGSYFVYDSPRDNNGRNTIIGRLRKLFAIPRKPYGPYQLYAREAKSNSMAKKQ